MGEVRLNEEGGVRVREGEILIEEGKRKTRRRGLLPSRMGKTRNAISRTGGVRVARVGVQREKRGNWLCKTGMIYTFLTPPLHSFVRLLRVYPCKALSFF